MAGSPSAGRGKAEDDALLSCTIDNAPCFRRLIRQRFKTWAALWVIHFLYVPFHRNPATKTLQIVEFALCFRASLMESETKWPRQFSRSLFHLFFLLMFARICSREGLERHFGCGRMAQR